MLWMVMKRVERKWGYRHLYSIVGLPQMLLVSRMCCGNVTFEASTRMLHIIPEASNLAADVLE
jgi:hypothetical protein